jgi:CspA family cold shock protein
MLDQELKAHIARLENPSPAARQPHNNRKTTTTMQSGKIKFFDERRGFGFIVNDSGGPDVFVHISAAEQAGITLRDGMRLSFELVDDPKKGKSKAVNLRLLEARPA